MSKCVKTGINIEAGGRIYHTDAHFEGNCLIFSACTERNADAVARCCFTPDLTVEGNYYHGQDGTIVCRAYRCTLHSARIQEQWRTYDEEVLAHVSIDITKG